MTEKERVDLLRLADRTVKSIDREINNLPRALVWNCSSREEIGSLREHFLSCIEDWRKRLPGASQGAGKVFLALIEIAEYELKEIEAVLYSLDSIWETKAARR